MTDARKNRIQDVLDKRQNDITIVLENIFDPHNIAAVLRTCDAVGIMEIFVLNTMKPNHGSYENRRSSSAAKWMMVHHFSDPVECFTAVKMKYKKVYSTHMSEASKSLYALDMTEPIALVFGNERQGLTQASLSFCDGNFIVPQVGMIQSLNISVACAVTLYEAFRQKNALNHYHQPKINNEESKSLLNFWNIESDEQ
jgi:tRNA (guanosine-2'-O-)-methyltransferase